MSPVPLIRQPFGLPPSPRGKAKDQAVSRSYQRQRRWKDHGSHGRPRAFPPSMGSRPSTGKETCAQVCTQDFSLGVWGTHVPTCSQRTTRRNPSPMRSAVPAPPSGFSPQEAGQSSPKRCGPPTGPASCAPATPRRAPWPPGFGATVPTRRRCCVGHRCTCPSTGRRQMGPSRPRSGTSTPRPRPRR